MLTSRQNPLVKQVRRLQQTQQRQAEGLLLLEGTHLLEEACCSGYELSLVCYTAAWQARYPALFEQVLRSPAHLQEVSPEVLAAMATTQTPDGVLAIAPRVPPQVPARLSKAAVQIEGVTGTQPLLALGLDRLQDPGNLGTIIRTAAAAGATGLWLSRQGVAFDHPKVLRASAGQWFRLPMAIDVDLQVLTGQAQAAGVQVVATRSEASCSYWDVDWTQPTLILLGQEGGGLAPELEAQADVGVQIPVFGLVESLNVAIAAALILYEAQRQRRSM